MFVGFLLLIAVLNGPANAHAHTGSPQNCANLFKTRNSVPHERLNDFQERPGAFSVSHQVGLATRRLRADGSSRVPGFYHFPGDGTVGWYPDEGAPLRAGYITGSAAHLEILRRSVSPERFCQIMAIQNPVARETEAQRALAAAEAAVRAALPATPNQMEIARRYDELRAALHAVPIEQPIPQDLMAKVYVLLRDSALWAPTFEEYLERNEAELRQHLGSGLNGTEFITARVEVVTGNVRRWFAGDNSQAIHIELVHRRAESVEDGHRALVYVAVHDNLFEFIARLFGEDRVHIEELLSVNGGRARATLSEGGSAFRYSQHAAGRFLLRTRDGGSMDDPRTETVVPVRLPSWFQAARRNAPSRAELLARLRRNTPEQPQQDPRDSLPAVPTSFSVPPNTQAPDTDRPQSTDPFAGLPDPR